MRKDITKKKRRYYDRRIYDLLQSGREELPVDYFLLEVSSVKRGQKKVWR